VWPGQGIKAFVIHTFIVCGIILQDALLVYCLFL
jgi:hypothetical protein